MHIFQFAPHQKYKLIKRFGKKLKKEVEKGKREKGRGKEKRKGKGKEKRIKVKKENLFFFY